MILKVFTKRTKGGEYIETKREWKEGLFEANNIRKKEKIEKRDCEIAECDVFKDGFTFFLINRDESQQIVLVNTDTQGYEILNDQGVSIERYVTAIRKVGITKITNNKGEEIDVTPLSEQEMVEALRKESDEEILNKCS